MTIFRQMNEADNEAKERLDRIWDTHTMSQLRALERAEKKVQQARMIAWRISVGEDVTCYDRIDK